MFRFAVPSKGELEEPTLAFLRTCGLAVNRPNSRQYTARIPNLKGTEVLFQRAADIPLKVAEGSVDLGIAGLDTVREVLNDDNVAVLVEDLQYGGCDLVIAVPETWIDVSSMADLVEVAEELRAQGLELRVATKFTRLTRQFLLRHGINYFTLVTMSGAIEAAPTMGTADVIADLSASGTTLRENGLKTLVDGTILSSQACLIGNLKRLRANPAALAATKTVLEMMEAGMRAREYFSITGNLQGESAEAVARQVMTRPEVAGMRGPTVSKVYSYTEEPGDWFAVTVVVPKHKLERAVEHLREMGGSSVTVASPHYVFEATSSAYERLLAALQPAASPAH